MAGYEKIGARWKSVANGAGSSKNPVDLATHDILLFYRHRPKGMPMART